MVAVVFGVDSESVTGTAPIPNEEIAEIAAANPDVLIPFASIDPARGAGGVRTARRLIDEHGVRGFKFHPNSQGFFPNDPAVYPLYEVIEAAGLPALFHTGHSGIGAGVRGGGGIRLKYSNPMHVDDVAVDFPDLKIVLAHPSFPWQDEAISVALHKPNVYIDLSGWSPKYFPEIGAPLHLARVRVQSHHGRSEQIGSRSRLACNHRLRIAGGHINHVELGVIGRGEPRHAAAVLHGLDAGPAVRSRIAHLLRHRVPAPLQFARLRIVRFNVPGPVEIVATHAGNHVVLHYQGRHGAEIILVQIANGFVPAFLAVTQVERYQVAIGSFEIEPVAIDTGAAIADMVAAVRRPQVVPHFAARTCVHRPGMIGHREVKDAVHLHRGRRDAPARRPASQRAISAVNPRQAQRVDVRLVDLRKRTVAASRVIAVISGPGVHRRRAEFDGIQARLRRQGGSGQY